MSDLSVEIRDAAERAREMVENVERVIIGKRSVVEHAVIAMLAEGHVLLEDVPGIGKTMLARALASSISGNFRRIQFTADLLPSDITGVNVFHQGSGEFHFNEGPLFCNVLLGDEINRATPRTQSSLLEAMEEFQATVDGKLHVLSKPFFVIATQNPIELEGTYPLPFAQMDRFMVRLNLGYLKPEEEKDMVKARLTGSPIEQIGSVMNCEELAVLQKLVRKIKVTDELLEYAVTIITATRETDTLEYGSSPRGTLDLVRFAQASALLAGRDYVLPDDLQDGAPDVLAHRVIIRRGTRHGSMNSSDRISELVEAIPVPM
jgi:MoxR-like ATPase